MAPADDLQGLYCVPAKPGKERKVYDTGMVEWLRNTFRLRRAMFVFGVLVGVIAAYFLSLFLQGDDLLPISMGLLSIAGLVAAFLLKEKEKVIPWVLGFTFLGLIFLLIGIGNMIHRQEREFLSTRLEQTKDQLREVRNALSKDISIPIVEGVPWKIYQFVLGQGLVCEIRLLGINATGILHAYRGRIAKTLMNGGSVQILLWDRWSDEFLRRARKEETFGDRDRSFRMSTEWNASIAILNDIKNQVLGNSSSATGNQIDTSGLESRFQIRFTKERIDRSLLFTDHFLEPDRFYRIHLLSALVRQKLITDIAPFLGTQRRCPKKAMTSRARQDKGVGDKGENDRKLGRIRYLAFNRYPLDRDAPGDVDPTRPGLAGPTTLVEENWSDYLDNDRYFDKLWNNGEEYSLGELQELYRSWLSRRSRVAALFTNLTRSANWKLVERIKLNFPTFHPQGILKLGDVYYLSSVEIISEPKKIDRSEGTPERTPGQGVGHLFKVDEKGELIDSVVLSEQQIYHPGGIDYDGRWIWVSVSEYRPNSKSIIYRVDPKDLSAEEVFRVDDHIGAVAFNADAKVLHGTSWGSRRFYSWKLNGELSALDPDIQPKKEFVVNGSHYIDYQDCQFLRSPNMICGGVTVYDQLQDAFSLGGIELIDLNTKISVYQIPMNFRSDSGRVMTFNPFYVEENGDALRFYFAPDDNDTFIYVWDAVPG